MSSNTFLIDPHISLRQSFWQFLVLEVYHGWITAEYALGELFLTGVERLAAFCYCLLVWDGFPCVPSHQCCTDHPMLFCSCLIIWSRLWFQIQKRGRNPISVAHDIVVWRWRVYFWWGVHRVIIDVIETLNMM